MKIFIVITSLLLTISGCQPSPPIKEKDTPIVSTNQYGTLNPDAPKETLQWGQLVGEWDCISKDLDTRDENNPKWYSNKATWKWEYILGGHALFNEWWQEDISPNPISKEYFAAGIFIFNPKTNLWEVVVMNSRPHQLSPKFQATYKEEKIEMHDGSGKWLVTFFDITNNSFEWKYEILGESGEWEAISTISAKRK